jgi:AcrR family transcriptional regulator
MVRKSDARAKHAGKKSLRQVVDDARKERTRRRLMDAAVRVIAAVGLNNLGIGDVLAEAKVSRGTFYNHFKTLDDLLGALSERLQDEFRYECDTVAASVVDPAERLVVGVRHVIHRSVAEPEWGWLVIHFRFEDSTLREVPARDIRAAVAAGRLSAETNVEVGTDLLLGCMHAAVRRALRGECEADLAETVAAFILSGLGLELEQAHAVARRTLGDLKVPLSRRSGVRKNGNRGSNIGRKQLTR